MSYYTDDIDFLSADIDVRDYIIKNYTPYDGNGDFLAKPTEATLKLWDKVKALMHTERERGGVYDIDADTVSGITAYKAGYIDKDLEKIVGLQTDCPLKRAIMPFGGMRSVRNSLESYGRKTDDEVEKIFKYHKTHNDGVFDVYTEQMRKVRHSGIITGLPDSYGRGRIIGDYRRVALYGVDFLIAQKRRSKAMLEGIPCDEEYIRHSEELSEQIRALNELKEMAKSYGFDISLGAKDTKEAFQWIYFAYLAAVKEQNGAAMSIGRISTFLDIYAHRDLENKRYTEEEIQEFTDHFIMKLRMVRFLRTQSYNELFSGDPAWVTESIGGMALDGRPLVTKMSFRFLHTLHDLGPAPEPNLTVLYSKDLPKNFKDFCADISVKTSSIQYENDDIMRDIHGDDYSIACCVSAMRTGKQMQFFGARANLAKALLYAINGGKDEKSGEQIAPPFAPINDDILDYEKVMYNFDHILEWLAGLYINMLNIIHYMHDKYCYERLEMALHDDIVKRTMACGIAGLSVVTDSLSAIRYAKVHAIRNEQGIVVDFQTEGDFPKFGNDDRRADAIAVMIVKAFMQKLKKHKTYRNAEPTLSILTITSNVVYGKKTGATPDGRKAGEPFAPGANPMHGRDIKGCVAAMRSVAKLPYRYSVDGISYTFSIIPDALGKEDADRRENLVSLLDGYFAQAGHHINVNVINRETLLDAMDHPEKYPQLTIRVSGYAVNFIRLSREQQLDVINRTFHEKF